MALPAEYNASKVAAKGLTEFPMLGYKVPLEMPWGTQGIPMGGQL